MDLQSLKDRTVACFSVSAKSQHRLDVMLKWLSELKTKKWTRYFILFDTYCFYSNHLFHFSNFWSIDTLMNNKISLRSSDWRGKLLKSDISAFYGLFPCNKSLLFLLLQLLEMKLQFHEPWFFTLVFFFHKFLEVLVLIFLNLLFHHLNYTKNTLTCSLSLLIMLADWSFLVSSLLVRC